MGKATFTGAASSAPTIRQTAGTGTVAFKARFAWVSD
jgi:hypothetical protein